MPCTYVGGTKVVRKTFDLSGGAVFSGLQDKSVQSIIGATEKRRESVAGGVLAVSAELSGIGICLFDGRRRGDGRNSVAVPGVRQRGVRCRQFISLRGVFVFCEDVLGHRHFIVMLCATNKPVGE